MANRYSIPFEQHFLNTGIKNAGGSLTFYLTGTSTPTPVYSNRTLSSQASNPQTLDDAGRPTQELFLDPNVTYKVVYKDSTGSVIWTADPVVDPAANVTAAIQIYPGNPNGNLAGNQGTPGGSGASMAWDSVNNLLYICTTTGTATTAVWTSSTASLAGAVVRSGIITPAVLSGSPVADAYNPSGFSGASQVRQDLSGDVDILDLPTGVHGEEKRWKNISAANFATLKPENSGSTANRRMTMQGPIVLGPVQSADFTFDGSDNRWVLVAYTGHNGRTVLTDAATVAWDLSLGIDFEVTLGGNRTLGAFTKGTPGQEGRFFVKNDATGGRTLALTNAVYDFWGPSIENIALGANEETEYAYKVVSSGSMLLRRVGATSIGHAPGLELLAVQSASNSATIDFVLTKWLSLYDRFQLVFEDVVPQTDDTDPYIRVSTDGGSTFDSGAANYKWVVTHLNPGTAGGGTSVTSDTKIILANNGGGFGMGNAAGETAAGKITFYSPSAARRLKIDWEYRWIPANQTTFFVAWAMGVGVRDTNQDTDAIRFLMSSGNITSGSFRLYGVRK